MANGKIRQRKDGLIDGRSLRFLKTRDRVRPSGPRSGRTPDRDEAIVSEVIAGETLESIGRKYGLSRQRVSQIVHRRYRSEDIRSWRFVYELCDVCPWVPPFRVGPIPYRRGQYDQHCAAYGHTTNGMREWTALRNQELAGRFAAGTTLRELAEETGFSMQYIHNIVVDHGVHRFRPQLSKADMAARDAKIKEARARGETLDAIAAEFGMTASNVRLRLKPIEQRRQAGGVAKPIDRSKPISYIRPPSRRDR